MFNKESFTNTSLIEYNAYSEEYAFGAEQKFSFMFGIYFYEDLADYSYGTGYGLDPDYGTLEVVDYYWDNLGTKETPVETRNCTINDLDGTNREFFPSKTAD